MTHHDLISHNDGWRCAVCGAVFPPQTMLEEILTDACLGSSATLTNSLTPVPLIWQTTLTFYESRFVPENHEESPVTKGERLLKAAGYGEADG